METTTNFKLFMTHSFGARHRFTSPNCSDDIKELKQEQGSWFIQYSPYLFVRIEAASFVFPTWTHFLLLQLKGTLKKWYTETKADLKELEKAGFASSSYKKGTESKANHLAKAKQLCCNNEIPSNGNLVWCKNLPPHFHSDMLVNCWLGGGGGGRGRR